MVAVPLQRTENDRTPMDNGCPSVARSYKMVEDCADLEYVRSIDAKRWSSTLVYYWSIDCRLNSVDMLESLNT